MVATAAAAGLPPTPFGDPDVQQRPLHGGARAGEVGGLHIPFGQRPLGVTPRVLRGLEVDLRGQVGDPRP